MVRCILTYLVLLMMSAIIVSAQSVSALASVDSSNYLVGDFINYTIDVRSAQNIQLLTYGIRDTLKKFEVIKELPVTKKEEENKYSTTFGYVISFYDSASVTIPPVAVRFKSAEDDSEKVVLSNPVSFTVHTLPVDQQADIRDVKEPLTIPLDWRFILVIAFIILIALAAAYYFYKRYKRKKAEQPVKKKIIRIPAHVRALAALDNLESEQLWQKGRVKEYHSNITGIIRGYFEERFNLPALELTTSEQMQQLKKVSSAENIFEETNQFLNNADLVKFAKFIPLPSVNEEMMKQAKDIVAKTIPHEPEKVEQEMKNV